MPAPLHSPLWLLAQLVTLAETFEDQHEFFVQDPSFVDPLAFVDPFSDDLFFDLLFKIFATSASIVDQQRTEMEKWERNTLLQNKNQNLRQDAIRVRVCV